MSQKESKRSFSLIWKLARNDFKTRYAGSYLGALWAMVQPVVTVLLYYIVFDKIFKTRAAAIAGGIEIPYVLFLTAGLVPWFYFSEGLSNGANALVQYSYLVKKVVFKIDILPVIKVVAASFIHIFFLFVLLVIAAIYGYYPNLYTIQLLYYSFCMFALLIACSYFTSAIVVFFRDLNQIISIFLQIGMWATPILWNIASIPPKWQIAMKIINPVAYIVLGYRATICENKGFWTEPLYTAYFWAVVALLFLIGRVVFKKLKVHFADVL